MPSNSNSKQLQILSNEYSQLINNDLFFIAKIDTNSKILFTNQSFCKFVNKTKSELLGKYFYKQIHSYDQDAIKIIIKNLNKKSSTKIVQQKVLTKEGIQWIDWVFTALFDEENNKTSIIAIGSNASKQKLFAETLIKNERKFRDAVRLAPFCITNLNGELLFYNQEFGKLAGFDPEKKYEGYSLLSLYRNVEDRDILFEVLRTKGFVQNYNLKLFNIHNSKKEVFVNVNLIKDINGNPSKMETTVFDNTEQINEYNILLNNKELLERKIDARTKSLSIANNTLKKKNIELENIKEVVIVQNEQLMQKNTALQELMSQISIEKENIKANIYANIDKLILPLINKLQYDTSNNNFKIINAIENNFKSITDSFGIKLNNVLTKLTTREIEICNYIKNGLSSKEISKILHISDTTVVSHRNRIRRKLNIRNTKANLATYLNTL